MSAVLPYRRDADSSNSTQLGHCAETGSCLPLIQLDSLSEAFRIRSYVKIFLLANKKKYILGVQTSSEL